MNRNDLSFPFRRYQIQPVWRADRPQKGRYREFWQCDADIVGSKSLVNEIELLLIYSQVFQKLNIDIKILFNNRKVLDGLANFLGLAEKRVAFITELDKLDKIGLEKTLENIEALGVNDNLAAFKEICERNDFPEEISPEGKKEIDFIKKHQLPNVHFDVKLARGLDYYTGTVMEAHAQAVKIGSLGGGGRYDDLTSIFGMQDVTGVGISFGLDRIYDVLEETSWPSDFQKVSFSTQVLFTYFDDAGQTKSFELANQFRAANIKTEVYPDITKMKKQMKYANDRQIPFVALIGEEEIKSNKIAFKNMQTGEQTLLDLAACIAILEDDEA